MPDLSVLIPARQEMWLKRTVEDVLEHAKADTEVIVVLDGAWADPPLDLHPKVQVIYHPKSVGQRAATNEAAKISKAKYIMKLDAHCSMSDGFDVALIESAKELGSDVTQIPLQMNLHVHNWKCRGCGNETYQCPPKKDGDSCEKCKSQAGFDRVAVWKARRGTKTTSWILDGELHFTYDGAGARKQVGDICDVMTSLGACFFMEREYFWKLDGLDEKTGSWGQYGAEIALKTWLSGGRHVVNKRASFAHFFRVGGINFPYEIRGSDQEKARQYSRDFWRNNRWPKQIHPLSWVLDKFWPVPGWSDDARAEITKAGLEFAARHGQPPPPVVLPEQQGPLDLSVVPSREAEPTSPREVVPSEPREVPQEGPAHAGPSILSARFSAGILYYSDCRPDPAILEACRRQLLRAANGIPIVSVTLAPVDLGFNIVLPLERSIPTMHRQILTGLKLMDDFEVIHFAEHDLLYSNDHFQFVPERADAYYYNVATYKVDAATGRAVTYVTQQLSGLCAYRALLLDHYRKRVERIEREGFSRSMGFEPGCHRPPRGIDNYPAISWTSAVPNIDIRHQQNLTPSRWDRAQFRNPKACQGWTEADSVPGWGVTKGRFAEILQGSQ